MDTSHINLLNIIPTQLRKVASTNGGEYHGACPFCGGKDRFSAQPNAQPPRWYCRQCQKHGDAIAFVMAYESCDFKEAIAKLNIESGYKPSQRRLAPSTPKPSQVQSVPALDNTDWQNKAAHFVDWSSKNLQSGKYPHIVEYLAKRGISLAEAHLWQIGYNPQNWERDWGGIKVYLPQGLVIPWLDDFEGKPRKVRIRRENPQDKDKRYTQAAGCANWLYNHWQIKGDSVVVLTEGEIDALSVSIGFKHHRVVPVATGGTTGARLIQWRALLSVAHTVLVAFDADDKGETAAQFWLENLPNAKRLKPHLANDVNEMLVKEISIKTWIIKEFR